MKTNKIALFSLFMLFLSSPIVLADAVTVSTDVGKYITATFQYSAVSYGSLTAGTTDNIAPDQASGVYNVTVDTNYDYKVSASGTDFSGAVSSIAIGNLSIGVNETAGSLAVGDSTILTTGAQDIETNLPYTNTIDYHGYWLDIPSGQYAESYSSTVTVTYANL